MLSRARFSRRILLKCPHGHAVMAPGYARRRAQPSTRRADRLESGSDALGRAAARFGFRFEGVFRNHQVVQVSDYFERRRRLANATMRMHPGEVIVEGDAVAQFVRGTAVQDGAQVSWQTIGVYRVDVDHRWISEVWLVPLDGELFDRIWSGGEQADAARDQI